MGKLVCVIEMDKVAGATITVTDAENNRSQTVTIDGTNVTIVVKDASNTSTLKQEPGRIYLNANDITLEAKEIHLKSQTGTWDSDTIKGTATQDITLESQATLSAKATTDLTLKGLSATLKADNAASVQGMTLALKGDVSLSAEGVNTAVKGTAQLDVQGAMVNVKASAMLACEAGGQASLKGALCQIQGSLITIG